MPEADSFTGWYQTIPLPDGRTVEGEQDCEPRWLAMRRLHGSLNGCDVLDLGAAEGYFTMKCAQQGATVEAVEQNPVTADRWLWVMSEAELMPFTQITFDDVDTALVDATPHYYAVLSLNVIHHLAGPLSHLYHCHRVLDDGGVLYLEAPHEPGRGVRLRKKHDYVLGNDLIHAALNRLFTTVEIVHDWVNPVGNRRVMWEAIK